jgi:HEAT repeat protein
MIGINSSTLRHPTEAKTLRRALDGDINSANSVLRYLGANPDLCLIMQETIRDINDSRVWSRLLHFLAFGCWQGQYIYPQPVDAAASQRIDRSIAEIFAKDEDDVEGEAKEVILVEALTSHQSQLRQAAAYLLGLRGDLRAIPYLAETIDIGAKRWQLLAVKALAALKDESCGPPLIKALALNRDKIHRKARWALQGLGHLAKSAWLDALDHPDAHIRWHAARGLGELGDASYAVIIAEGLFDENYAVRWATADVLARLGSQAVPATLTILSQRNLTEQSRQAANHALHGITSRRVQQRLKPLLDALHSPAASVEAPVIAQRLLMEWDVSE